MKLNSNNIETVKGQLENVAKLLGAYFDDFFSCIEEGDEDIVFCIDCAECTFDIDEFLLYIKDFAHFSYDDFSARCGLYSQYNIWIEGYFDGIDAKYFFDKFQTDGLKIRLVEKPILLGLRNIKENIYDSDCWSPFAEYVALEFVYDNEQCKLSICEEKNLVQRVLFYLNSKYSKTFILLKLPDHNPIDDYCDDDLDAEDVINDNNVIDIKCLPQFSPMLQMYINAKEVKDPSLRFLMFYKILEYISPFVAKKNIYERLNQRLDRMSVCERDSEYLDSLIELTRAYDNSMKDGELAKIVLDECADLVELQTLIPLSIKKRMMSDSNFGKNVKWNYENIKRCEDKMKITLANFLYSTRNSIVHAKSNYNPTGFECQAQDISQFDEMLQSLCYTIVYWKDRH